MKYFLLFLIIITLLSTASYSQNGEKLEISISQHIFPYGPEVCYVINRNNINVLKTTKRDVKVLKCVRTLSGSEIDSLKIFIHNIFKTYDISNCRLKPLEDLINYLV